MADITLTFTQDELEMLVDALEVDLEGYVEAAKEARLQNSREDIVTFTEASVRIQTLMAKLQDLIEE
ncbi:MAG: hypothetical protein ACKOQM_06190 [Novosphingobium sp.]